MGRNEELAMYLASQGKRSVRNPIARFALGLPTGSSGVDETTQYASQKQLGKDPSKPATSSAIQDKLLARIRTVSDTGFAVPGPGVLPGYALRPEVRQAFESMGGVAGFDVSNMSPEEQNGLRLLLDPKWVAENQGRGT
jgi:hypothetical protein